MRKYQLISMLTALLIVLSGCSGPEELPDSQQKLQFSVVPSESPGYTVISKEKLGENSDVCLAYGDLAEVNILLEDGYTPLPEAIRGGEVTIPELFAFARMDSENGFCKETYKSEHGLTHFTYTYPECELELAYDVYETPSGEQQLIEEIYIYDITDHERNLGHFYVDQDSEWGYFLDREDWGLNFEVFDVSPTQITLDFTQKGGQQIGELFIEGYSLYRQDKLETEEKSTSFLGQSERDAEGLPIPIVMNTSGQITIDWSAAFGTLEPGTYFMKLSITDIYDQSNVHPLMANYYDTQGYNIVFAVE